VGRDGGPGGVTVPGTADGDGAGAEARSAVNDAHRREWAYVLAATARVAGDLDLAEECVQDAYLSALEAWTRQGVPDRPGAWLTTAARRRALDALRRERTLRDKLSLIAPRDEAADSAGFGDPALLAEEDIPDDRLRLVFTCCHPALGLEAQIALTLRLVCGLTTRQIADAFLVSEATMAARVTRAKKKIAGARIPYRIPEAAELPDRLRAVLAVVHLLYTTAHTDPSGAATAETAPPETAASDTTPPGTSASDTAPSDTVTFTPASPVSTTCDTVTSAAAEPHPTSSDTVRSTAPTGTTTASDTVTSATSELHPTPSDTVRSEAAEPSPTPSDTVRSTSSTPAPAASDTVRSAASAAHLIPSDTVRSGAADFAIPGLYRADLAERAIDLARMLAALMPDEAEVRGLLALLLLTDARRETRVDADGHLQLLADQDRSRWDQAAIAEGTALVTGALRAERPGRYAIQAAIAALHAEAPTYAATDWPQIVQLYGVLLRVWPSPVVRLNRAAAVSMADGPQAALAEIAALEQDGRLAGYRYLSATKADLLRRLGRFSEAADAYEAALDRTWGAVERGFLERRITEMRESALRSADR